MTKIYLPLVTVVIPTRNRKEMLCRAISSVLSQSYSNLQIIVHDNNSTDGTEKCVKNLFSDSRIEYYRSNIDLEMTENWNQAMKYIRGKYFVRLDDDNVFFNNLIEKGVKLIQKQNLDMVTFSPLFLDIHHKLYSFFNPGNNWYLLDKYQLAYLEFFNLTDSNYEIYKTDFVIKLMGERIYRERLPDRFLGYTVADNMSDLNIRVGLSEDIMGLSRYDYRQSAPSDYHMDFVDYWAHDPNYFLKFDSARYNQGVYRLATLDSFMISATDQELKGFIGNRLMSREMYSSSMALSNVVRLPVMRDWHELATLNLYYFKIILDLFRYKKVCFETYGKLYSFYRLLAIYLVIVINSIKLVFVTAKSEQIDSKFGDRLSDSIINGNEPQLKDIKNNYGSLFDNLIKIKGKEYVWNHGQD